MQNGPAPRSNGPTTLSELGSGTISCGNGRKASGCAGIRPCGGASPVRVSWLKPCRMGMDGNCEPAVIVRGVAYHAATGNFYGQGYSILGLIFGPQYPILGVPFLLLKTAYSGLKSGYEARL